MTNGSQHISWGKFLTVLGIILTIAGGTIGWLKSDIATANEDTRQNTTDIATLKANDNNKKDDIKRIEEKVDDMNKNLTAKIDKLLELVPRNPNRQ